MTTKMAIIAGILGVIVLTIVGFRSVKSKQQAKIKENFYVEEKYSDYKYFREIKQAEKYDLIPLDCYGFPTPPYFAQDGSVVIFAYVSKGNGEKDWVCYKLDKKGNVKDSLVYNEYKRESEFFLNKEGDGYITWLIDGDKRVKAYHIINNEPSFNEQVLNKVYDEMYEKSDIVREDWFSKDADDGSRISIVRTYFFHNGEWSYIDLFKRLIPETFGKYNTLSLIEKKIFDRNMLDKYYDPKGGYDEQTEMQTQNFSSAFEEEDGDINQLKTEYFHPLYFMKEKFIKGHNASPFDPYRVLPSPSRWSGIGFLDLILKEDTLKIKMDMDEIARNNGSYSFYGKPSFSLYYDEKVDFFILSQGEVYCCLIKPKN